MSDFEKLLPTNRQIYGFKADVWVTTELSISYVGFTRRRQWQPTPVLLPGKSHGLYVAHQAPLSMRFSRQEYWNGLPFPSAGDLPDPGRTHVSCIARQILYCWATMEALSMQQHIGSIVSLWFLLKFWIRACQSIYQIWRQKERVYYSWGGGAFVVEELGDDRHEGLLSFQGSLSQLPSSWLQTQR